MIMVIAPLQQERFDASSEQLATVTKLKGCSQKGCTNYTQKYEFVKFMVYRSLTTTQSKVGWLLQPVKGCKIMTVGAITREGVWGYWHV
jgi:hypothetical protein